MARSILRTIRFRMTFWYAMTLAVILAASALFSYYFFSQNLKAQIDREVSEVASLFEQHHNTPDTHPALVEECDSLEHLTHSHNWGAYVQLRDDSLQIVCTSDNLLERRLPLSSAAQQQVGWMNDYLETVRLEDGVRLRLLSHPLTEDGRLIGVIQVAQGLGPLQRTIDELKLIYLVVSPFAVFLLCLGCWFLARRMLAPIIEVSEAAQQISADNLERRLSARSYPDELSQMVSSLNQMLDRLHNSFRRVRQFSGDASHELRTPLTILRGETEVTLRWAKTTEEFRDMLRSNMEEIDRMERIIESLLLLTKSEAGELPLEMRTLSLSDLVQELYIQSKILCEPKKIEVRLDLNVEEEIKLCGDELRLRQLFLNLISNAVKYSQEGGYQEIALSLEGDLARVDIVDSGIGIAAEHLPRIFDRFYRIDKARNRQDGGAGLGLSIVKWIVDAHGGSITVVSKVGQGSTFSVRLPLTGSSESPKEPSCSSR